jgi:hypothetical protein
MPRYCSLAVFVILTGKRRHVVPARLANPEESPAGGCALSYSASMRRTSACTLPASLTMPAPISRTLAASDSIKAACAVLDGSCRLLVAGQEPITLVRSDFVLEPAAYDFAASSLDPPPNGIEAERVETSPRVFRIGSADEQTNVRLLVGHCAFGSEDADLLVSLLPRLVHVRGQADHRSRTRERGVAR